MKGWFEYRYILLEVHEGRNNSNMNFVLLILVKHVKIVHEGRKKFKCDICNSVFGHKYKLNTHVATVHDI